MKRYRIWHDGTGMQHPFKAYFAGWIDTLKEAKKTFKRYCTEHKGELRLDEFLWENESFVRTVKIRK